MPLENPTEVPEHFDDREQESDAASLGMWVFLTTEVLFFGVLFASYTVMRARFPEAFAIGSKHTDLLSGSVETACLLTSTFTMSLAVRYIHFGRPVLSLAFLVLTICLGVSFEGIHWYEYHSHYEEQLIPYLGFHFEGPHPQQVEMFFFLYYVMTGWHLLHLTIGVCVLIVISVLTVKGKFSPSYYIPVEISGLYWHFVDIVWMFLFPLFYLVS